MLEQRHPQPWDPEIEASVWSLEFNIEALIVRIGFWEPIIL